MNPNNRAPKHEEVDTPRAYVYRNNHAKEPYRPIVHRVVPAQGGMELRSMEPRDLTAVKRLHEQCFPVRYDMAFYENVVRGFIARGKGEAKEPLYTQVAVVTPSSGEISVVDGVGTNGAMGVPPQPYPDGGGARTGDDVDSRGESLRNSGGTDHGNISAINSNMSAARAGDERDVQGPGRAGPPLDVDAPGVDDVESTAQRPKEQIVGLITCQVVPLERCRDRDRLGLRAQFGGEAGSEGGGSGEGRERHCEVVYILTLGTEKGYRRRGIGRALLRRCIWLSRQEESIGAVYLHVITTNPPAHRFYESEGFVQVCCINDYYKINGQLFDCFLYALFVNGAQPPGEWGWSIQGLSRRLLAIIAFFRRTLGHVPEESRLAAAVAAAGSSSETEQQHQDERGGGGGGEDESEDGYSPQREQRPAHTHAAAASAATMAAAASCGGSGSSGDGGAAAGEAPVPTGRGFAWSVQRGVRPGDGSGKDEEGKYEQADDGVAVEGSGTALTASHREASDGNGARLGLMPVWSAAAVRSSSGGRARGVRPGIEEGCGVGGLRDGRAGDAAPRVRGVGTTGSAVDVTASENDGRRWGGRGSDAV